MKPIEQVRAEFECPTCKKKTDLAFQEESAHCHECDRDYDLGPRKHK